MFTLGHTQEEIEKANNLVYSMKYKVEEFTGMEVDKINIYVEGVRVID